MNTHILTKYNDHIKQGTQWISTARKLYSIQIRVSNLTEEEQKLKIQLKTLSEDKNGIGGGYAFTMTVSKGRIDYKQIPELVGLNLEPYRGMKTHRWQLRKV